MKKIIAGALLSLLLVPELGLAFRGQIDRGSMLERLDAKGKTHEMGRLTALNAYRQVLFLSELSGDDVVSSTLNRRKFDEQTENYNVSMNSPILRSERATAYARRRQDALTNLRRVSAFDFDFHIPLRVRTY